MSLNHVLGRWLPVLLAVLVTGLAGQVAAQTRWTPHTTDAGCKLYLSYENAFSARYIWKGGCEPGQPISGVGELLQLSSGGDCDIFRGEMQAGYWVTRVQRDKFGTFDGSTCVGRVYDSRSFTFPPPPPGVALTLLPTSPARPPLDLASCGELSAAAVAPQAALCNAHAGCRIVLGTQASCTAAQSFLQRLQAAIGEGTKGLFGTRKEVTPDAVFTAALGAEELAPQRALAEQAPYQQMAQQIGAQVRESGAGDVLTGAARDGSAYAHHGQVKSGVAEGTGTRMLASGEIQRGQFSDQLSGEADVLWPDGSRFVGVQGVSQRTGLLIRRDGGVDDGTYLARSDTFSGVRTLADGSRFEGRIVRGLPAEGRQFRADGSLAEEGRYENGQLSVGQRVAADGTRAAVDLPAQRQAEARAAAQRQQQEAEAVQQRQREEQAQAQQAFVASLQGLNPGQLFARADELAASGDMARARLVRRTLVSRFPDHALAAAAASQMAGEAAPAASAPPRAGSVGAEPPASGLTAAGAGSMSAQDCAAREREIKGTTVPSNASITAATETVMFMTRTVLDMIEGGCPGVPTPERKRYQDAYASAQQACDAVQSGGRRCAPVNHFGPGR